MTDNGNDIQTILTKRTDLQTDRVLLFGQVVENKEKADPSAKPKEPFFANHFQLQSFSMATNKHATIRYHALDRCFSNYGRKFFIEDLIIACNEAIYEFAGVEDGVKEDRFLTT